jgi:hypothetical protein
MERTGVSGSEAFRFYQHRCDRVVAQVLQGLRAAAVSRVTLHWHQMGHVALPGSYLASPSHSGQRFSR